MSEEIRFTKEQFVQGTKGVEQDVLRVVLEDGKKYSKKEAEKLKVNFLRKRVR